MRMLIIDDDARTRGFVAEGLRQQGQTVDEAGDGGAGLHMALEGDYDAIVVDRMMPGLSGLDVVRSMRTSGLKTPVLMLTALGAVDDRVDGLNAGADDYLVKPFDLRELAARLHALLRRAPGRTTHLVEHGSLTYDPAACTTFLAGQPVELSRREQALLQALLHNPGRVLSAEQLKDAVYGLGEDVESNALNVHIHYLRRKLGNGIVETVRGLGYRLGTAGHGSAPPRETDS